MNFLPIKRAIFSVTDKSNLLPFVSYLANHDVELVSTGGTAKFLSDAGFSVTQVSEVTGFQEILNGRVKTLHPHIHAGILADKDNPDHMTTVKGFGIKTFDLVCVNLYNFAEVLATKSTLAMAIEQIDIGGPCMLRAAAKNYHSVAVVPSPQWYNSIKDDMLINQGAVSLRFRHQLATATFAATSAYDAMITAYLAEKETL